MLRVHMAPRALCDHKHMHALHDPQRTRNQPLTITSSQHQGWVPAVVCFVQGSTLVDVLLHPVMGQGKRCMGQAGADMGRMEAAVKGHSMANQRALECSEPTLLRLGLGHTGLPKTGVEDLRALTQRSCRPTLMHMGRGACSPVIEAVACVPPDVALLGDKLARLGA